MRSTSHRFSFPCKRAPDALRIEAAHRSRNKGRSSTNSSFSSLSARSSSWPSLRRHKKRGDSSDGSTRRGLFAVMSRGRHGRRSPIIAPPAVASATCAPLLVRASISPSLLSPCRTLYSPGTLETSATMGRRPRRVSMSSNVSHRRARPVNPAGSMRLMWPVIFAPAGITRPLEVSNGSEGADVKGLAYTIAAGIHLLIQAGPGSGFHFEPDRPVRAWLRCGLGEF